MSNSNLNEGCVIVSAAFPQLENQVIVLVQQKLNCTRYISFKDVEMHEDWIIQQDNAPTHFTKESKSWFLQQSIPLFYRPVWSPFLNRIENFWGYIARKIYSNSAQNHNI